ncbi:MAG: phthiocerol/phthiodiolone dimycocerosyl transferase family protein [Segniliparus sp.]|uniref:phthiocerol/phthiodiolone dimycocerosyl transferase family protein n=1 Tax=Segniliparus sp. TaxID=2804064 RepID=UPI003F2EB569
MNVVPPSGPYRRRLSAIEEEEFVREPQMTVGWHYSVRGELDHEALVAAFTALRREYPDAAGRIEAVDDGFDLVVDGPEASAAAFVRIAQTGDDPVLNLDETLSVLDVVSDGDRHVVTFRCNHAIADGTRLAVLVARLWSLYTQAAQTGSVGEISAAGMPIPPHEVFASRGIVRGPSDGSERLAGVRWHGAWPTADEIPTGELRVLSKCFQLAPDVFAGLRMVAKQSNCTLHGLLVGAAAIVERELFTGLADDEPAPLGFGSFVDLRLRMAPPVGAAEVTNCMTVSYARLDVAVDSDPVELGRFAAEQLAADIADELLQQAPLHPPSAAFGEPWTVVNYLRSAPPAELPAALTLEDTVLVFEKGLNQIRGAVAAVQGGAPTPSLPVRMYVVYSVVDRLTVQVLDTPGFIPQEVRDRMDGRFAELLTGIARRAEA